MNDSDFIRELSPELTEYYLKARQVYSDSPELCLVFLRSYAHDLCAVIAEGDKAVEELTTLFRRVEKLEKKGYITPQLAEKFHTLRKDANKGAHPEQFNIDKRDYHRLALANMEICCQLAEQAYWLLRKTAPPAYRFEKPRQDSIKDLCYAALVAADPEAQYLVGLSLRSRAEEARLLALQNAEKSGASIVNLDDSQRIFERANYLFAQAAFQDHVKAMYEHGCVLLLKNSEEEIAGVEWIRRAALAGYDSALSRLGLMYFNGTPVVKQDVELALEYLEKAAITEHPEALTLLGAVYFEGSEVERDIEKGFQYSYKGAVAGYPEAQYNLSLYYLDGLSGRVDLENGLKWLSLSVEQQCSKAEILLASLYVDGDLVSRDRDKAYELYLRAIYKNDLEAMLEFALLSKDNVFNKSNHLSSAADYLQLCYENSEEGSSLREIIIKESPVVLKKLRKWMKKGKLTAREYEEAVLVSSLFDKKNLPVKDRKKRLAELL